jgi:protein TonB
MTSGRHARPGSDYDALTGPQRRVLVGAIVAAHVGALWAVMQVREVRDAVSQVAPVFASLIAPEKPPEPAAPPPIPSPQRHVTPQRIVTAAPSPAPAPFVVAAPEVIEPPAPAQVAAPAPAPEPATAPQAAPEPKVIPASAVQYLEPPSPEYPSSSKRLRETGRVLVRVHIDEAGLTRDVQVARSSGHPILDDAAMTAVRKARFKPYTENGRPVAGWAFIPINFELER